mgnify:CR=1 FL=1
MAAQNNDIVDVYDNQRAGTRPAPTSPLMTEMDRQAIQTFSAVELSRQLAQDVLDPLCAHGDRRR